LEDVLSKVLGREVERRGNVDVSTSVPQFKICGSATLIEGFKHGSCVINEGCFKVSAYQFQQKTIGKSLRNCWI
jgi:hypothetical protein